MSWNDPWYKATYPFEGAGVKLELQVPHDVFSTQRIDEGTLLLLNHLQGGEPGSILDVGCGYGALGLPIAARFPRAQVTMIDRDLLAVEWSRRNAEANRLSNAVAAGSLGFRDLPAEARYDWILCNVPARIGRPFIEELIRVGRSRLTATGDLRLVVIHDLMPVLEQIAADRGWPAQIVARGPRHTVVAYTPELQPADETPPLRLYERDAVEVSGLRLARPFDLGGDDPKRLRQGLPLLIDALPRDPRHRFERILCFRPGYGFLPVYCRRRWSEATVVAVDRDLLGTTFTQLNAEALSAAGPRLEIREQAHFPDALSAEERFDLILGEVSPSAGKEVAQSELRAWMTHLSPKGQALLLCLDKVERDWVRPFVQQNQWRLNVPMKREGYSVVQITT